MSSVYRVDFYNLSGTRVGQVTDFLSFTMTKRVNYPGVMQVTLVNHHPVFQALVRGYYAELWRKDPDHDVAWRKEFGGIYRGSRSVWPLGENEPGVPLRVVTVVGYNSLLADRVVAYPANTVLLSTFSNLPAESISKILVEYNLGAESDTANDRIVSNPYPNLTVQTDAGGGKVLHWACAEDNLLQVLQDIAKVGGGDFDIVRTTGGNLEFRWYSGQLGTNRTGTLLFSMESGNMRNPVWIEDASQENTLAIVGGSGQNDSRTFITRQGTYFLTGTNSREIYVDARDVQNNTNLLNNRGDQQLKDREVKLDFEFEVVQTEACVYGRNYFLGDKAKARNPFTDSSVTVKVDEVSLTVAEDGREEVSVKVVQLPTLFIHSAAHGHFAESLVLVKNAVQLAIHEALHSHAADTLTLGTDLTGYFVSPSGSSSGAGTFADPWSWAYALAGAGGTLAAGDTVWIRGGNYDFTTQTTVSLDGASGNPIKFKAYPGEVPHIRGSYNGSQWLWYGCNHLSFYDIVFEGYNYGSTARTSEVPDGTYNMAGGQTNSSTSYLKFYGCVFKNFRTHGFRAYECGDGFEMNGCIVAFNGQSHQYDHGIYTRGILNNPKLFRDCVVLHNASHGIHQWGYSTGNYDQDDLHFHGCTFFQNGSLFNQRGRDGLFGGSTGSQYDSGEIVDCEFYNNLGNSSYETIKICYSANNIDNFLFDNNIMAGRNVNMDAGTITNVTFTDNLIYGTTANVNDFNGQMDAGTNNTRATSWPTTGTVKRLRTMDWDSRRGKWTFYNWADASSITVTNSEIVASGLTLNSGDTYYLHNTENYHGDIVSGTYNGTSISVPMTGHTVETPYGGLSAPTSAFPKFGCFIIRTEP